MQTVKRIESFELPRVPATVRAAVRDQLEEISPLARRLIGVACVLGPAFDASVLKAVADMEREQMETALLELERLGLLSRESPQRYCFTRRLLAEALYSEQPLSTRTALHHRIATALEKLHGHDGAAYSGEIARHFAACIDSSTAENVVKYAAIAARRAAAERDFGEAERMYSHALRAMDLSCSVDYARRCDLLMELGEAQGKMGDHRSAEESLRTAAELAERLGDGDRLTEIVIGLPAWHWPSPGRTSGLAALLAERALAIDGRPDKGRRAMVQARLAAELSCLQGEEERGLDLAAAALDMALSQGDPRAELYVRCFRDCVVRQPDRLQERLTNANEVVRLAIQVGDYASLHIGTLAKCGSFLALGDIGRADGEAHVMAQTAAMSHQPLHDGVALAYRGSRAVMEGRFVDASLAFTGCRNLAAEYRLMPLSDACWPAMMLPLGEEGRLSELEAEAEETVQRRSEAAVYQALLSWIKTDLGRTLDAVFHFERLAADKFANLCASDGCLASLAALTEACVGLNKLEHAERLYDLLAPHAGLNVTLDAVAVFGSAHYYLGKLAAGLGRLDTAVRHFEDAIQMNKHIGARTWSAYAGCELARTLLKRGEAGDRERALEVIAEIEAEAAGLGMFRLLGKVRQTRDQLGNGKLLGNGTPPRNIPDQTYKTDIVPMVLGHAELDCRALTNGTPGVKADSAQTNGAGLPSPSEQPGADLPEQAAATKRVVAVLYREAEYWTLGYQGNTFRLRHRKGLSLICHLLRNAGREFCATDLAHHGEELGETDGGHSKLESNLGPVLDTTAKQAYRKRLQELREELEQAHELNDPERIANIEEEQNFLTREFARAIGLFGHDRKTGSETERARQRVTFTIRAAIRIISEHDASLGQYLARSIRTGSFCSYTSDPGEPIEWRFQ